MILVYIDRICERNPSFMISSLTVHRFIITAVTCASKALCDTFLTNSTYAKVGGVSTKELNILEVEFLHLIDWRLTVQVELLQSYYLNLVKQVRVYLFNTEKHPKYQISCSKISNSAGLLSEEKSQLWVD